MKTNPIPSNPTLGRSGLTWLGAVATSVLLSLTASAQVPLDTYDAVITTDSGTGLVPVATLTEVVTLTGTAGWPFDFGVVTGAGTIEFILEGNPGANNSSFLAVGSDPKSSLRYEVWNDTGELGFTLGGVADYQFSPGVASPTKPTHVTYVWNPDTLVMTVYINGKEAGKTTGVDAAFKFPSGSGKLGSNPTDGEPMAGTFYRVTVYDSALDAATILRHSDAFGGDVLQALNGYDAAIAADTTAGLAPLAQQTSTVLLPKTGTTQFDFGATSDDVTIEFLLKGDPSANESAFLAVGENSKSSLRFEVWFNTGEFGFTQGGVADYQFSPGVSSAQQATHVTYAWNAATLTMKIYLNGILAGTTSKVDAGFAMPRGLGYLGSNNGGGERMVGTIYRVTVYDDLLTEEAILRHAKGFTDVLQPPLITSFTTDLSHIDAGGSVKLSWAATAFKTLTLNGKDVSTLTSLDISPVVTTRYLLEAKNPFGTAQARAVVYVNQKLDAYDAAIAADATAGLVPSAVLTNVIDFTGTGGSAFDFGTVSDSAALEVIIEGDPLAGVNAYLAVGDKPVSNLRYAQYANELQYGFTQLRVADYLFTPPVPSSAWPTHLTFVWDADGKTLSLYVNGTLAGTTTGVSDAFGLPSGAGFLGSNPDGAEALVGTIFRVTTYDDPPSEEVIKRHADAFLKANRPTLSAYDTAITEGSITPVARLYAPVVLDGTAGFPFDMGASSGDGTAEFIVEGDPDPIVSGFLAVGNNSKNSLRYEVWFDTGELGFTLGGVADYQFTPGVPSPRTASVIAYVWQPDITTMTLYVNGVAAGSISSVDSTFELPTGVGKLGSAPGNDEGMVGTIHRVAIYDEVLPPETLIAHANRFLNIITGPTLAVNLSKNTPTLTITQGVTGKHYQVEYQSSLTGGAWQVLADIPALVGTTAEVTDPTAPATQTARYYRVSELP